MGLEPFRKNVLNGLQCQEMFQKSSKPEPEMGMVIYDTAL
jgi:hypothetical protein